MIEQRQSNYRQRGLSSSIYSTLIFMLFLFVTPESFADSLAPLTVEHPPKQTIVLTQGISTTIHSERPFGKISITNPEVVDLVLQTDKSAVLIPERLGRTNVDFLDDKGVEKDRAIPARKHLQAHISVIVVNGAPVVRD